MRRFQNPPPAPSHQAALLGWIKARFVDAHAPGALCGSAGGGSWGSGAHSPSSLGTQDTSTFFAAVWMLRPCAGWGAHPGDLPGRGQACGVASASREPAQHLSPRILSAEGGQRGRKPPSPTPRRSSVGGGPGVGPGRPGLPPPSALPVPPTWYPVPKAVEAKWAPGLHISEDRGAGPRFPLAVTKELMLLNCGVGEDPSEALGLQGDQPVHPKGNQS